ncbi:UPF0481 protein At3g47200-like [Cryptomeria japonica]|uniref:UPF0481 protein At3g47200-like n=1 Tax=Cryptomeria japonica TaxID=3369 RepID=UPI0027DA84A8|nr:UPF0481 protein At3g47200-like [Cryptomeria japonica]
MRRKVKLGDSSTSTFRQDQKESGIAPQPSPASSTICRVRQDLRAIQPEKYNPKRVALGICNHAVSPYLSEMDKEKVNVGKEKVNMGKEKVKALCTTIKRLKDVTVESLVAEIQRFDLEIRKWYDYSRDSLPEEILAWNFAMDGCFILEFFRLLYRIEDPIVEREIMTDILMLENQIPLFVLKKILELEFQTPEKTISNFCVLTCMRPQIAILPFSMEILLTEVEENMKEDPSHLLHLLSKSIEAFLRPSNVPIGDWRDYIFAVVVIEQEFPIRFKPSRDGQVRFKKGWFGSSTLYLPQIYISEETEPLLWNLMAFSIKSESNIIAHFIFFMNCIMSLNNKTIALLKKKQIIISKKSEEELHAMFSGLTKRICGCGPFDNLERQLSKMILTNFVAFNYWCCRGFAGVRAVLNGRERTTPEGGAGAAKIELWQSAVAENTWPTKRDSSVGALQGYGVFKDQTKSVNNPHASTVL